jgi:thiamine biosynthesis lipoprotein
VTVSADLAVTFRSMAADIEIRVVDPAPGAEAAIERAVAEIGAVATHLTRFDPESALSRANRTPGAWHEVPAVLADAVAVARSAHRITDGLFDPRVGSTLAAWGYDRTFDRIATESVDSTAWDIAIHRTRRGDASPRTPWEPKVEGTAVNFGGAPIDFGGIGKGLAVRHAAAALVGAGRSVLVDAGGDEWLAGPGPDGDGWKVGVEDPLGLVEHVLVLAVTDLGVATSSIAKQRWTVRGVPVHHLVDPRTNTPGGAGLAAATVLHPDPAWAEVWSKTLFLTGHSDIAAYAEARNLAAAWVTVDGEIGLSSALRPFVLWQVTR